MKILTIVMGVLLAISGVYCLITPIQTYAVLGWLIGLSMLVEGIASIVTWNSQRKLGYSDGFTLVGGIISILLGLFLLFSYVAQLAIDMFIAYLIAAWLVVGGIVRIVAAFNLRKYQGQIAPGMPRSNWVLLLLLGILVVILGVLCLFNPLSVMVGVGFMLGLGVLMVGIGFIVSGVRMQ